MAMENVGQWTPICVASTKRHYGKGPIPDVISQVSSNSSPTSASAQPAVTSEDQFKCENTDLNWFKGAEWSALNTLSPYVNIDF